MREKWKSVSVKNTVGLLIASIIFLCFVFVPAEITETGSVIFLFQKLPILGDGTMLTYCHNAALGIGGSLALTENIISVIEMVMTYVVYGYFGILILDLIFAILLVILRVNGLRKLFRFFSVIFGILFVLIAIVFLLQVIGTIMYMLQSGGESVMTNMLPYLLTSGAIPLLALMIGSCIMSGRQFKSFTNINADINAGEGF